MTEIAESIRAAGAPARGTSGWKRFLSLHGYGLVTSALFRASTPPLVMRRRFERFAHVSREAMQQRHPGVTFEDHFVEGCFMESVCAGATERTLLHLHGGAFLFGSAASYRARAVRLSYRCKAEVFVPEYRLAPEHPFPAALDDALAAYETVRARRPTAPLFLSGDSAGGGLVLSLLVALRDRGAPMPDGAVVLSPWTDLTHSGPSIEENGRHDLWLDRRHLEAWGRHYVAESDARDPRISPAFADLTGLPRLMLLAGDQEVLLDDTRRVAANARAAGVPVKTVLGAGMQHDYPLTLPWLDESRAAWLEITRFVGAS